VLELEVTGDCRGSWNPCRIQQLLNNLVLDALHYGEPGGAIGIALRGSESHVRLSVANTGETIDGETLAHMFEPLRRGKSGDGSIMPKMDGYELTLTSYCR